MYGKGVRALASCAVIAACSCAFGGYGDYEIRKCDPKALSESEDECSRLVNDDPCASYQCDVGSQRCVLRPLDSDRDGEPPPECGGLDCNDGDRNVASGAAEICDRKDNNCNGVTDEGVVVAGDAVKIASVPAADSLATGEASIGSWSGTDLVGAYAIKLPTAAGYERCLQLIPLPKPPESQDCSFLKSEPSLLPRQPQVRLYHASHLATFVVSGGCEKGRIAYRVVGGQIAGAGDLDCVSTSVGAALPSVAPLPPEGAKALVAWYEVPLSQRDDRVQKCAGAKPAALRVVPVENALKNEALFGTALTLEPQATSMAPAAMLPIEKPASVLIGSPAGSGAALHLVGQDGKSLQKAQVSGMDNARAVALALRQDTSPLQILVVGELGCEPQSIAVSLGSLDATTGVMTIPTASTVVPGGTGRVFGPAAAFVQGTSEWILTWTTGSIVRALRLDAKGVPIGDAIEVGAGSVAAPASKPVRLELQGTDVYVFVPDSNEYRRVELGCL